MMQDILVKISYQFCWFLRPFSMFLITLTRWTQYWSKKLNGRLFYFTGNTHTTIHNVSNRRNSPPCRILRSRYGERNVPNEPRRLNLNKKLTQEVRTWDSDEKIMRNIPLFFIQSLAMGGVIDIVLSLISFCHSFLFVTHFFLSLISFCHSFLKLCPHCIHL